MLGPQNEILDVLKKIWGFDKLKEGQLEILESVLAGHDTIAVLPTGGGKSLCYQLPAVLTGKITLVISPLLALMRDQACHLQAVGIRTCCLNSELKPMDLLRTLNDLGNFQVIYSTPEFIQGNSKVIAKLKDDNKIGLLAIDEAHCASSWGHDFRPSFLRLGEIRSLIANKDHRVPILALTATAPPAVIRDISKILRLENPVTIIGDLGRKNLLIRCIKKTNPKNPNFDISQVLDYEQNTIIYTLKKDETELIYNSMDPANKPKAAVFHADLSKENKDLIYQGFMDGRIKVLIATIAFGMGIDKKDIRCIINWGAPANLETYYQEIGRAGRDNLLSTCYLFWSEADLNLSRFHVTESIKHSYSPTANALAKENLRKINVMENYIRTTECRIGVIIKYFKSELGSNVHLMAKNDGSDFHCRNCDNCLIFGPTAYSASTSVLEAPKNVDYAEQAILLFNLMVRLEINYGTNSIVAILRGAKGQKIKPKLMELPEYGKGASKSEKWWKSFIKFIVAQGYLNKVATTIDGHMIELLELSPKATSWISSSDTTLVLRENLELSENQGKANADPKKPITNSVDTAKTAKPTKLTPTIQETMNHVIAKKNLNEIAVIRGFAVTTIESHITAALDIDESYKQYLPNLGISEERLKEIISDFKNHEQKTKCDLKSAKLRDIKELFSKYSYFEIKVGLVLNK